MKLKKIVASFLSIVMLLSLFPVTINAQLVDSAQGRAKITAVLLQSDNSDTAFPFKEITAKELQKTPGTTFYVGYYTSNFSNIKEYNDFVKATPQVTGFNGICIPLSFNDTYLEIEPNRGEDEYGDPVSFSSTLTTRMTFGVKAQNKSSILKQHKYQYNAGMDVLDTTNATDTDKGLNKYFTINLEHPNTSAGTAPPYAGPVDGCYLGIVEFKFKDNISNIESNTKLIGHSNESAQTNMSFGVGENQVTYQDNADTGETGPTQLIYDVIEIDTTAIDNLIPPSYKVTYNAGDGTYPDGFDNTEKIEADKTKIVDGASVTYGNPTLKNTNGDVISENVIPPTGKIFKEWQTTTGVTFKNDFDVTEPITVNAIYGNGYTVNFNLNGDGATYADGDDALKFLTVLEGKSPAANAIADEVGGAPTRDEYTFKGWYTKKNGAFDTKYTDDGADGSTAITAITGQTDLYAMWDNAGNGTYKLHFHKNGGATDADPNVVGYSNATDTLASLIGGLPKEPTTAKDGYKFIGWYKNESGDGKKLTDSKELLAYTGATNENPETTVYAKWGFVEDPTPPDPTKPDEPKPNSNTVTITFPQDANNKYEGGIYTDDAIKINNRYIKYGETVPNLPTDMKQEGKGFAGWYTAAEGGTKVEADTIIDSSFGVSEAAGGTVSLYAHWDDQITIKYDVNGLPGATNPSDQTVLPTDNFTPHTVDKIGGFDSANYTLVGWNTEKNGSGTSFTAGTEANVSDLNGKTTLYAIWNYKGANNVTVVFNGNDTTNKQATLNPNNGTTDTNKYTIVRQAGTTIAPEHMPTATRTDYNFDHWDLDKTAAAQGSSTAEAQQQPITVTAPTEGDAMNVYAIWRVDDPTKQAVVNFDLKATDTTPASIDSITIAKGDSLGDRMPANPKRTGYSFDKWTNNAGGADFDKDTVVTESSTTVNANWTLENTVTYDRNGLPDSIEMPAQVKGAPDTAYKVADIDFKGASYELVEWNTKANGTGETYSVNADKTIPHENLTLYAIWNSTDPNAKSIKFLANDSTAKPATLTPHDTDNTKIYTMKRMPGTVIQANQMPGATRDDYDLDHWGKTATEALLQTSQTQEAITVGTEDITRYAIWDVADGVTSHTVSFVLHGATNPTTIADIVVADGDILGDRMPADPERTNYTFKQWTTGTSKTAFVATDPITSDITLDANWTVKVDVKFTTTQFDYDGNPHTPITDGNYVVFLKGTTSNPLTGLTLSAGKYLKVTGKDETQDPPTNITEELPAGVTVPVGGGEYTYENLTLTEAGGDGFTEYDIHTIPDTFKINAKDIEITIGKNYQYIGSGENIEDITITSTDTDVNTNITGGDIKVTFTDKDSGTTNTMPTNFGHYTIKVESTNDSYNITKVKDGFGSEGEAIPLYLINLQREIKVDYIDGINKNATDIYTTVTLTKPTTLNSISDAKTTLAGQTPALDVPQQGTDFDPPTGMRIKKFVTGTKQADNTIADPVDFDKDTTISFSETNEPLTIYAIYENADWTLKFSDTKTSPAAETFVDYTVDAEKSVKDGLKKKGSTEVTDPAEKVLPKPTAAPDNMMFGGWTTDQSITTDTTLTMTDLNAGGKHADKMFTDETEPTADQLGTTNGLTVYAVYVKSSDATLKSALFKEILVTKDDDGTVTNEEVKDNLKYVDALPTPADDTITFDPDTDTYNIIVKNDFEKLLADLEPTQSGATISVKVNDNPVANETEGVPAGHTQAKPGVDATTYNKDTDTNSTNTIVVTVTAPDGTTKDYTFNVLRYAEAKIVLNYGNSPYGEIMRATNIAEADKETAKQKFNGTDNKGNTFRGVASQYLPKDSEGNVVVNTRVTFNPTAWENSFDPDKNMDRNDYAVFIYDRQGKFTDPGFTATDSLGKPVLATDITRTITVQRMAVSGLIALRQSNYTPDEISVSGQAEKYLFDEINASAKKPITPDTYRMTYSFEDSCLPDPVTETRPVVVLWNLGDLDMSNQVNAQDIPTLYSINKKKIYIAPQYTQEQINAFTPEQLSKYQDQKRIEALYLYRIGDADMSNQINAQDIPTIYSINKKKISGQLYNTLQ